MSITIKRRTRWQGMASNIQIKVNGENVASVAHNQHAEVHISDNKVNLKVTQFGVKSNVIEVKDGDIVKITPTLWYRFSYYLFIAVMIITLFIPNFDTYRSTVILILGVFLFISSYLINGFNLEIINFDSR